MLTSTRKRSRQEILEEEQAFDDSPWGDTDDECEPIEEFEHVTHAKDGKRRRSGATEQDADPSVEDSTPVEQCLADLRKLRDKVRLPRETLY